MKFPFDVLYLFSHLRSEDASRTSKVIEFEREKRSIAGEGEALVANHVSRSAASEAERSCESHLMKRIEGG